MTDNCNICVHIVQFWSVINTFKNKRRRRRRRRRTDSRAPVASKCNFFLPLEKKKRKAI